MPTLQRYPRLRGQVKMHNKGRVSVPKSVREDMGVRDGAIISIVEWKQGTFLIEKSQEPADGYRPFQAG